MGKGKSQVGKMDAVLKRTLTLGLKYGVLINVIVPKLVCKRSMGREHEVRKTAENSADDSS